MTDLAAPDSAADLPLLPGAIDLYVSARAPTCRPEQTVAAVRRTLVGATFDGVDELAVCTGQRRLVGVVALRSILASGAEEQISDLMDPDPPVVVVGHDREQAAWKAVQHGETSLAVVDQDGAFRGLVPPARLLGVLLHEHDEDFARLGGYLATTASARLAVAEPMSRRLWHRLPWLVLGLAGAAVSAWLVGLFGGRIEADVRLAFFIPGVVYLADAVGTQTEALVVRGLSVGAPIRPTLRLEALTGPALGALLAGVSLPAIWLALGDPAVAVAVSVALLAACSVATVVAAGLPMLMARAGRDPAFGSGPLATVVQDLLSLVIYLTVAVVVVGGG